MTKLIKKTEKESYLQSLESKPEHKQTIATSLRLAVAEKQGQRREKHNEAYAQWAMLFSNK